MGRGPSLPAACVPSLIPAFSSSQPTPGGGSLARLQGGPALPGGSGPVSEVLKRHPRGCLGGRHLPPSSGVGVAEAPRDLVADIPWRPRGPNWQGQLRTAAGPALFAGWRLLSIQALLLLGARWAAGTVGPPPGVSRGTEPPRSLWRGLGALGGWGRTRRSSRSRRGSSCTSLTRQRRRCRCGRRCWRRARTSWGVSACWAAWSRPTRRWAAIRRC